MGNEANAAEVTQLREKMEALQTQVEQLKTRPAQAVAKAPGKTVSHKGYRYRLLDGADPDGNYEPSDVNSFLAIPEGWELAPVDDQAVIEVVGAREWSTKYVHVTGDA